MPIVVKPIEANLIKDTDVIGKDDPFCVVKIGSEQHQTKVCNNGGKYPKWYDTFTFNTMGNELLVSVYDKDAFNNQLIGEGTCNLAQIYQNGGISDNEYVDLIHHGKSVGRVLLSIEMRQTNFGNQSNFGAQQSYGMQGQFGNQPNQAPYGGSFGANQGNWDNQGNFGGNQGNWGNQGNFGGNQSNQWGNGQNQGW